jgi:hypothetical protein
VHGQAPAASQGGALPVVDGPAAGVAAPAAALPLDRSPVTASVAEARDALGDVVRGDAGGAFAIPALSAPVAWSILLVGLFGLLAIARGPAVARAQAWAACMPSRSDVRSRTRASALDRVDPARYAQAQAVRSHGGHFVRTAGRTFAR